MICDEIYDRITYDDAFTSIGRVAKDSPVILLNGFSKVNLMTGWRLGYIAFADSPQLDNIKKYLPQLTRVRIAANMPAQYAALESLRGPQGYIDKFVAEMGRRRDMMVKRLNSIPNLTCPPVKGAFYAFPHIDDNPYSSDKEFVLELLRQKGVLTVHGSGFGEAFGREHFRLVFLPPIPTLNSALDKIEDFMTTR